MTCLLPVITIPGLTCANAASRGSKIAEGLAPYAVARQGLLKPRDPDSVYSWLAHYQRDGLAGLLAHQQGGLRRRHL